MLSEIDRETSLGDSMGMNLATYSEWKTVVSRVSSTIASLA
jgi:hypothetical protein